MGYRYGFNGKEQDNEVKGKGNQIAFENRIYDPRLGRWFSLDPLQRKYPGESNYTFVSDNPILYADKDGRDKIITITFISKEGKKTQIQVRDKNYFLYTSEATYGGHTKYYKYDVVQELTIDLQNNTASFTSEPDYSSSKEISWYQHTKVANITNDIKDWFTTSRSGDNSNKKQFGWRFYGVGKDMEWQKGLPTSADGEEGIDLAKLLEAANVSGPSTSHSELYAQITRRLMKTSGKDMEHLYVSLNLMVQSVELSSEILKLGIEVANKSNEPSNKPNSPSNTTPKIDPGKNEVPTFCRYCNGKFIRRNGVLTTERTNTPAKDSAESHGH